jgi:hypothetical protein
VGNGQLAGEVCEKQKVSGVSATRYVS